MTKTRQTATSATSEASENQQNAQISSSSLQDQHQDQLKAQARAYALSGQKPSLRAYSSLMVPPPQPQGVPPPPVPPLPYRRPSPPTTASTTNNRNEGAPKNMNGGPQDDDYMQFVKSLGISSWDPNSDTISLPSVLYKTEDEDDEFQLTDLEDEEDDDDEDDDEDEATTSSSQAQPPASPLHLPMGPAETSWENELDAELCSLLEEDLEAAVTTLMGNSSAQAKPPEAAAPPSLDEKKAVPASPSTPLRDAARQSHRTTVSARQVQQLQSLLQEHYQLLLQQAILSVRIAQSGKSDGKSSGQGSETAEDLMEIIDGAVGMLQDLDQNRKDAIRYKIQSEANSSQTVPASGKRSLLPQLSESASDKTSTERRLTRSAFYQTLQDPNATRTTTFDVRGLARLEATFAVMDNTYSKKKVPGALDILAPLDHAEACRMVFRHAGAKYDERLLPGVGDVSFVLSEPKEVFGAGFFPPATEEQQLGLRRNRNQFTAAEDNLVLRGVNLYGEKQWILIADRYLPDRSVNSISQRYSKLCLMLYRAHGIHVDPDGNLETPPKDMKLETLDEAAVAKLKKVEPPAILNVHRWSIEEDLTLLKAVPIFGHMWAELSTRLVPHRDRGHLRKRYQVLERRVKATVARTKRDGDSPSSARPSARKGATASKSAAAKKRAKSASTIMEAKTLVEMGTDKHGKPPLGPPRPAAPYPGAPPVSHPPAPAAARLGPPTAAHPGAPPYAIAAHPGAPPYAQKGPVHQGPGPHRLLHPNGKPMLEKGGLIRTSLPPRMSNASLPAQNKSGQAAHVSSEYDPSGGAESTRTGYEKILNEGPNDWSQASRLKKVLEQDPESLAASAGAGHGQNAATERANVVVRGNEMNRLPNMELDTNTSSGFSLLNSIREDITGPAAVTASPPKRIKGTIMANVLERVGPRKSDNGENHEGRPDGVGFPTPTTPSRTMPATRMSSFGTPTPIGFSPAVRNMYSPGIKNAFSPGPGGFKSCFSPGMHSLNMSTGHTQDGFEFTNLEISDRSRQAFAEGNNQRGQIGSGSQPPTPSPAEIFEEAHGLREGDLEAISALNSLSNSPARYLTKRPASQRDGEGEQASLDLEGTKMSLFAAVVGGIEKKETKKRRTS